MYTKKTKLNYRLGNNNTIIMYYYYYHCYIIISTYKIKFIFIHSRIIIFMNFCSILDIANVYRNIFHYCFLALQV